MPPAEQTLSIATVQSEELRFMRVRLVGHCDPTWLTPEVR